MQQKSLKSKLKRARTGQNEINDIFVNNRKLGVDSSAMLGDRREKISKCLNTLNFEGKIMCACTHLSTFPLIFWLI